MIVLDKGFFASCAIVRINSSQPTAEHIILPSDIHIVCHPAPVLCSDGLKTTQGSKVRFIFEMTFYAFFFKSCFVYSGIVGPNLLTPLLKLYDKVLFPEKCVLGSL